MRAGLAIALVSTSLIAGCTSTPATTSARTDVPWKDYASNLQVRIDRLEAEKKCTALQAEFETATKNDEATRRRVGHGNADLMQYISEAENNAGCFK